MENKAEQVRRVEHSSGQNLLSHSAFWSSIVGLLFYVVAIVFMWMYPGYLKSNFHWQVILCCLFLVPMLVVGCLCYRFTKSAFPLAEVYGFLVAAVLIVSILATCFLGTGEIRYQALKFHHAPSHSESFWPINFESISQRRLSPLVSKQWAELKGGNEKEEFSINLPLDQSSEKQPKVESFQFKDVEELIESMKAVGDSITFFEEQLTTGIGMQDYADRFIDDFGLMKPKNRLELAPEFIEWVTVAESSADAVASETTSPTVTPVQIERSKHFQRYEEGFHATFGKDEIKKDALGLRLGWRDYFEPKPPTRKTKIVQRQLPPEFKYADFGKLRKLVEITFPDLQVGYEDGEKEYKDLESAWSDQFPTTIGSSVESLAIALDDNAGLKGVDATKL